MEAARGPSGHVRSSGAERARPPPWTRRRKEVVPCQAVIDAAWWPSSPRCAVTDGHRRGSGHPRTGHRGCAAGSVRLRRRFQGGGAGPSSYAGPSPAACLPGPGSGTASAVGIPWIGPAAPAADPAGHLNARAPPSASGGAGLQVLLEEAQDLGVGPPPWTPRLSLHESHVPPVLRLQTMEPRRGAGGFRQTARSERIIRGAEQQGGAADGAEHRTAGAAPVVVLGRGEAVDGRGHHVIE